VFQLILSKYLKLTDGRFEDSKTELQNAKLWNPPAAHG